MRPKTWTGLRRQSETLSVFDWAERAQRDLDPLRVVPADVGVHGFNELFKCRGLPVPRAIAPSRHTPKQFGAKFIDHRGLHALGFDARVTRCV